MLGEVGCEKHLGEELEEEEELESADTQFCSCEIFGEIGFPPSEDSNAGFSSIVRVVSKLGEMGEIVEATKEDDLGEIGNGSSEVLKGGGVLRITLILSFSLSDP